MNTEERCVAMQRSVLGAAKIRYNGTDEFQCPFCSAYSNDSAATIDDLIHDDGCAYLVAKGFVSDAWVDVGQDPSGTRRWVAMHEVKEYCEELRDKYDKLAKAVYDAAELHYTNDPDRLICNMCGHGVDVFGHKPVTLNAIEHAAECPYRMVRGMR